MDLRLVRSMTVASALTAGIAILGATPGLAQFVGGGSGPTSVTGQVQKNLRGAQQPTKSDVQPPVLPGTKGPSEVAEPTSAARDLSPTDALFDAINRGDLTAVREATNRGADLDARNLLGLTPLDLSVDLGRNDISFALLSMRREYGSTAPTEAGAAAQRTAEMPRAAARARVLRTSAGAAEVSEAEGPRYSPGNGGMPIPAAGFVGFDARAAR